MPTRMNLALTVTLHLPVDGNDALLLANICFRPHAQNEEPRAKRASLALLIVRGIRAAPEPI